MPMFSIDILTICCSTRKSVIEDLIRLPKISEHSQCIQRVFRGEAELRLPRPLVFRGESANIWYQLLRKFIWGV